MSATAKLAAGTIGELLVREGYTSMCDLSRYFQTNIIEINGVRPKSSFAIVYHGDIVTIGCIESVTVK